MTKFKDICQFIEHYGGNLGDDQALIDEELVNSVILAYAKEKEKEEYRVEARVRAKNKALAIAFLKRSDKARDGQLLWDLKNQYSSGTDQYPKTVTEAYNLLVSYKKTENTRPVRHGGNNRNNLRPGGGNHKDSDAQDRDASFVQAGGNTPISEITATIANKWDTMQVTALTLRYSVEGLPK